MPLLKDIPQLKELGVKSFGDANFPISQTKRTSYYGDDSKFVSEMPKEEQHKYLCYFMRFLISKVNPEFGTIEDFRKFSKNSA